MSSILGTEVFSKELFGGVEISPLGYLVLWFNVKKPISAVFGPDKILWALKKVDTSETRFTDVHAWCSQDNFLWSWMDIQGTDVTCNPHS